jgi:multiple sugar transport system substrate-binding protein
MSEEAAKNHLGAIRSRHYLNMILDLRIPSNQRYQQIVLDTAVAAISPGKQTSRRR